MAGEETLGHSIHAEFTNESNSHKYIHAACVKFTAGVAPLGQPTTSRLM